MSLNEYMHERNRYRLNPPNFKELAEKHQILKPFLIEKQNGGATLNFREANAIRALTIALAKEDFHLDLELNLGTDIFLSLISTNILFYCRSIDTTNSSKIELSPLDRRSTRTSTRCNRDRYWYR